MIGVKEIMQTLEVGWRCRSCGCRISERNCHLCGCYRKLVIVHGLEHVVCSKTVSVKS